MYICIYINIYIYIYYIGGLMEYISKEKLQHMDSLSLFKRNLPYFLNSNVVYDVFVKLGKLFGELWK